MDSILELWYPSLCPRVNVLPTGVLLETIGKMEISVAKFKSDMSAKGGLSTIELSTSLMCDILMKIRWTECLDEDALLYPMQPDGPGDLNAKGVHVSTFVQRFGDPNL
jgi:hypothetical protein